MSKKESKIQEEGDNLQLSQIQNQLLEEIDDKHQESSSQH